MYHGIARCDGAFKFICTGCRSLEKLHGGTGLQPILAIDHHSFSGAQSRINQVAAVTRSVRQSQTRICTVPS